MLCSTSPLDSVAACSAWREYTATGRPARVAATSLRGDGAGAGSHGCAMLSAATTASETTGWTAAAARTGLSACWLRAAATDAGAAGAEAGLVVACFRTTSMAFPFGRLANLTGVLRSSSRLLTTREKLSGSPSGRGGRPHTSASAAPSVVVGVVRTTSRLLPGSISVSDPDMATLATSARARGRRRVSDSTVAPQRPTAERFATAHTHGELR